MKRWVILLSCLLLAAFPACAEESAFKQGDPHTHTLDFRLWFETMSAETDACTLSIQQTIYDEAQADELLNRLRADLEAICALTGASLQPHTVYVAEKLFAGVQRFENRVYCRAS